MPAKLRLLFCGKNPSSGPALRNNIMYDKCLYNIKTLYFIAYYYINNGSYNICF